MLPLTRLLPLEHPIVQAPMGALSHDILPAAEGVRQVASGTGRSSTCWHVDDVSRLDPGPARQTLRSRRDASSQAAVGPPFDRRGSP
jgi:hypothetical protein